MLGVKGLTRPPRHPLLHIRAGVRRFVVCQGDEVRNTGAKVRGPRQIVALFGFLEQRRNADAELTHLTQVKQGQDQIEVGRVELPRHAGALFSQDRFGAIQ